MLIMINTKFIFFIDINDDDTLYVPLTETYHFITKKNILTSKFSNDIVIINSYYNFFHNYDNFIWQYISIIIRVNNYIASKFSNDLRLFLHFQIFFF